MNLNPLKHFSFTPRTTAVQTKQTSPQVEDKTLPQQEQVSIGQSEPHQFSRNAFVDGVGAASEMTTIGAGIVTGASGGFALGAATVGLTAAALAVTGPLAAGLALVAGGAGALIGAAGGASLAEKASEKLGEWGSKLAGKLGFSSKSGEAAGRASLAVGLGASAALAGPVALFALACGLANKGVGMAIDAARSYLGSNPPMADNHQKSGADREPRPLITASRNEDINAFTVMTSGKNTTFMSMGGISFRDGVPIAQQSRKP